MESRHWYLLAIVCSAAFILLAIFPWRGFDPTGHWHRIGWIPFVSRPVRLIDVAGNLLLFVPLGVSIALHARRPALARTATAAFACSLFGEWAQIYSRYRYPSTGDLVLNVLGALMGAYGLDYLRRRAEALPKSAATGPSLETSERRSRGSKVTSCGLTRA